MKSQFIVVLRSYALAFTALPKPYEFLQKTSTYHPKEHSMKASSSFCSPEIELYLIRLR